MIRGIKILPVVCVLLAFSGTARAVLLSDLLNGQTIMSGDKLFSEFHGWQSTVNPAHIVVTAWQNPTNQEYGLKFTSDILKLNSIGGLSVQFDFIVTATAPGYLISDNTLTMAGTVPGGNISITETAKDAATEAITLASKMVIMMPGYTKLVDHQEYSVAVPSVHVRKYISLAWSGGSGAGPQLTEFTQTFSQIPEPATMALLALGGLLLRRRMA